MKRVTKLVVGALMITALLFVAAGAFATEVTVSNQLDVRLSLAFAYYDQDSGSLVTKGWWYVDPRSETTVTLAADESRDIYYAAFNKDLFIDSSTRQNPQIQRWASYKHFTYAIDGQPDEDDVWQGRFYKANGSRISIDSKPHGK